MSDLKPDLNGPSPPGLPIVNEAGLQASNSQAGNVAQIVASPGSVVHQTHVTHVQSPPGLTRTDLLFWVLMALAVVVVASKLTVNIGLPPVVGQWVAGGVLAGIVWKLFERVEAVLTENTKLEIAVWLLGVKVGQKVEPWPETFAKVFDRVFGTKHLSWKCFCRSSIASYGALCIVKFWEQFLHPTYASSASLFERATETLWYGFWGNVLPDFVSLLESRYVLHFMKRATKGFALIGWLLSDAVLTSGIALTVTHVMLAYFWVGDDPKQWSWTITAFRNHFVDSRQLNTALSLVIPAFFTSIWLWLYAGSGFLLKAARRFDIGFEWFNRKFDIEKKPLSSIGLVAGALVAVVYWGAVIVSRVVR
jgi:hypothetical protein